MREEGGAPEGAPVAHIALRGVRPRRVVCPAEEGTPAYQRRALCALPTLQHCRVSLRRGRHTSRRKRSARKAVRMVDLKGMPALHSSVFKCYLCFTRSVGLLAINKSAVRPPPEAAQYLMLRERAPVSLCVPQIHLQAWKQES